MAKARIKEALSLTTGEVIFPGGEEVYAFWFDSDGEDSVDNPGELPIPCEGWTLHIQSIGSNGESLRRPREWDFDYAATDLIEIIETNWTPR